MNVYELFKKNKLLQEEVDSDCLSNMERRSDRNEMKQQIEVIKQCLIKPEP